MGPEKHLFKPTDTSETAEPLPMWLHLQLPKRDPDSVSDQPADLSSFEDYETRPQYIPKRVRFDSLIQS